MKSSIKIDVDLLDRPIITIKQVHTSSDLRDKSLVSFLRKIGFEHAKRNQVALLLIEYDGWGGGSPDGDCYEEFVIRPLGETKKTLEHNSLAYHINGTIDISEKVVSTPETK